MKVRHGISLLEVVVVLAVIFVLASILFPMFAKSRERSGPSCTSQLRQLATAVLMYNQDNGGTYPGTSSDSGSTWVDLISTYVGNSVMFHCPSDKNTDTTMISYAYNALLVRPNRCGVAEKKVTSPSDLGCMCDADTSDLLGGLVGGGVGLGADFTRTPSPRHSGVIIGYCDGHAKFAPGTVVAENDMSCPVNRAFFMASALGWVDNPCSGLASHWPSNAVAGSNLLIGGEYCTRPILQAAAEMWKNNGHADYCISGWKGQNEPVDYPDSAKKPDGWIFGCGDNGVLSGANPARSCIAKDAVVFIVAINSKIAVSPYDSTAPYYLGKIAFGDYACNTACLAAMWSSSAGYDSRSALCYQVYDLNARAGKVYLSGTRAFVMSKLGISTTAYGAAQKKAITAYNDEDMVNKVAADPYGIGYCSAAFADTNRMMILGIAGGKTSVNGSTIPNEKDGHYANGVQLYPSCNAEKRWLLARTPGESGCNWPFARKLYIKYSVSATNQPIGMFAADVIKGGSLNNLLQTGPLFRASFYKP